MLVGITKDNLTKSVASVVIRNTFTSSNVFLFVIIELWICSHF